MTKNGHVNVFGSGFVTAREIAPLWRLTAGETRQLLEGLIDDGRVEKREIAVNGRRCLQFRGTAANSKVFMDVMFDIHIERLRRSGRVIKSVP